MSFPTENGEGGVAKKNSHELHVYICKVVLMDLELCSAYAADFCITVWGIDISESLIRE